jgi:hypothetical protein
MPPLRRAATGLSVSILFFTAATNAVRSALHAISTDEYIGFFNHGMV